ncbi:hypothetical protein ES708_11715 [subsurface metagenome]
MTIDKPTSKKKVILTPSNHWCNECQAWTWHLYSFDGHWECLQCISEGRDGKTLLPESQNKGET